VIPLDWFTDYTLRTVIMGSAILGATSGALGSFAVLRRQALLGDAVAHSTLPGIVLAFVLTGSKAPLILLIGAALTGWLATLMILLILRQTRIREDAALGISLSIFFGFGIVLLSWIQKLPVANKAGLDRFLFGQAAALMVADVIMMSVFAILILVAVIVFWKEFKLLSFNPEFGATLGLPMRRLDITLTGLIVISIVLGLQMVGVVLMSAMLLAPAAAARQWTDRLAVMVVLSAVFGALAGATGTVISASVDHLPTGPTIIVVVSVFVMVSLLFAPARGLVWEWRRRYSQRRSFASETVLVNLYQLAGQHGTSQHPHDIRAIEVMMGERASKSLKKLQNQGWVKPSGDTMWMLTESGEQKARNLLLQEMH
jgi:manganese/zinc/iron transport system permease protein